VSSRQEISQHPGSDRFLRWTILLGCSFFFLEFIAYSFVDIDLWHQVALIRDSLAAGHLLRSDPYAYTPTLPWVDHEWGAGALAFFTTQWFGPGAIIALKILAALGTLFACLRCSQMRGAHLSLSGGCALLGTFLLYLGFFPAVRAQAYSFFFAAVWLCLLELDRRGSRVWIIAALLLLPVWLNLHAGFAVAFVFTALYAVEVAVQGRAVWHLPALLCAMTLEIFANPYGSAYFAYLRRGLWMARPYSAEWSPLATLGMPWIAAFAAALLIAAASILAIGWSKAPGLLILTATALEATVHRKLLPLFAVAWLCYVPAFLQATPVGRFAIDFSQRKARFLSSAWILLACLCAYGAARQQPWELRVLQPIYPIGAVEYFTRQQFVGNVMVPFRLGAYVSYKLYPRVKVSVDSRYEVAYPDAVVKQMSDFYAARPDWLATLNAYPTDAVLVPADEPIARWMPASAWNRVYSDRQFQIYVRPGIALPAEDGSARSFSDVFP